MATNFPGSLDSFTNPSASDAMDSVTVPHATQHANLNDAVEALESKVGVDGSAVTSSLDYQLNAIGTWINFTPTWSFTSGTINPNVATGRYMVVKELVIIQAMLRVNSVSGSGDLQLIVPSAAAMDATLTSFWSGGYGTTYDANTLVHTAVMPYHSGSNTIFNFRYHGGFICTSTSPITWANNDELFCTIIGEKP